MLLNQTQKLKNVRKSINSRIQLSSGSPVKQRKIKKKTKIQYFDGELASQMPSEFDNTRLLEGDNTENRSKSRGVINDEDGSINNDPINLRIHNGTDLEQQLQLTQTSSQTTQKYKRPIRILKKKINIQTAVVGINIEPVKSKSNVMRGNLNEDLEAT